MGVKTFLLISELEKKQWPGPVCSTKYKAICIACELSVKIVDTFGVVLYRNQWPVNFILHFAKLTIGSSIEYKNTLFINCFLKCLICKIILICFNCFIVYNSC